MARFAVALDTATPRFRKLAGRIQARGGQARFLMRWGARIRKVSKERAIGKGGRKFWREIARSINLIDNGRTVEVQSTHRAAAQKQYGGAIEARGMSGGGADYLTIPILGSEAEGRSAAEFALAGLDMFALGMDDGRGVLGYSDENDEFVPLFVLVRKTKPQKPDPFVPLENETLQIGIEEAEMMIKK